MKYKRGRKSYKRQYDQGFETRNRKKKEEKEDVDEHRLWECFFFVLSTLSFMTEHIRYNAEKTGHEMHMKVAYYLQMFQLFGLLYFAYGFYCYKKYVNDKKANAK